MYVVLGLLGLKKKKKITQSLLTERLWGEKKKNNNNPCVCSPRSPWFEKKKKNPCVCSPWSQWFEKKKFMSMCCRVRHQRPSGSRVRLPCAARPLPCCPALPLRRDLPLLPSVLPPALPSVLPPALPSVLPRHRRRGLMS